MNYLDEFVSLFVLNLELCQCFCFPLSVKLNISSLSLVSFQFEPRFSQNVCLFLSIIFSGIMETTSQVLVPSPSSPDNAIVSPETLSHHSSPAKSSRVLHYAQHVTIDETRLPSSLRSSRQQLLQQSNRSTPSTPPPPFQSGQMTPTMSVLSNHSFDCADSSKALVPHHSSAFRIDSQTTKSPGSPNNGGSTTTQHLAVLYQTHHHLHPILTSPARRQSRLPDTSRFLHQQALQYTPAQKEISA